MLLIDILYALEFVVLMISAKHCTITADRLFASLTEIHKLEIMATTYLILVMIICFYQFAIFSRIAIAFEL